MDLVRGPLPSWSQRRVVTVGPGDARPFVEDEWRDALVIVEQGSIELECTAGGSKRFGPGDLLYLVGLPLHILRNDGPDAAVLVAISRRAPTTDPYGRPVAVDTPHRRLREVLQSIATPSPTEAADVAATLWVVDTGDPWSRHTPLHVTCSALVVHPPTGRVLLRWHERQQAWLQVGGHADPGETDPYEIARREAVEETGLTDLGAWPGPEPSVVHLVVVPVPAGRGEPAHEHADLRYLLATAEPDAVVAETERAALRWLSLDEAAELTSEDNLRETLARTARLLDG